MQSCGPSTALFIFVLISLAVIGAFVVAGLVLEFYQ